MGFIEVHGRLLEGILLRKRGDKCDLGIEESGERGRMMANWDLIPLFSYFSLFNSRNLTNLLKMISGLVVDFYFLFI